MSKLFRDYIVKLCLVHEEMEKHDTEGFWEYRLPNVRCTKEEIELFETSNDILLDKQYKEFLLCANGWEFFYQTVTLFGLKELKSGEYFETAKNYIDILEYEGVLEFLNLKRNEILPIATTLVDTDLFVLTNQNHETPGVVVWIAGQEIERFANFEEFFLAMIDHNIAMIDDFK